MNNPIRLVDGDKLHNRIFNLMDTLPKERLHIGGYHTGKRDAYLNVIAEMKSCEPSIPSDQGEATRLNGRYDSLLKLVQEVSELISWRDNGNGNQEALKMIYTWISEDPSYKGDTEPVGAQRVPSNFRNDLTCSACLGEPYHHSHTYQIGCADYGITIPGVNAEDKADD